MTDRITFFYCVFASIVCVLGSGNHNAILTRKATSGPISIINKNTLYIPNLQYDGTDNGAQFWIGSCTSTSEIVYISYNNLKYLPKFEHQNIYLQVANNSFVREIDNCFGVKYSENEVFDKIVLNFKTELIPENSENNDLMKLRIPKCCPIGTYLIKGSQCQESKYDDFQVNVSVHSHNETHLDDTPMNSSLYEFILYQYNADCTNTISKVPLFLNGTEDDVKLLWNTSLIVRSPVMYAGVYHHGDFCFDRTISDQTVSEIYSFVCSKSINSTMIMKVILSLSIISSICFSATAIWYGWYVIQKVTDVHKICFIAYCIAMTLTFIFVSVLQDVNIYCTTFGILFIFFMLCSYNWMVILCWDLYTLAKNLHLKDDESYTLKSTSKLWYYLPVSIICPVIVVMISLLNDGSADVPQSFLKNNSNLCNFESTSVYIFYVPITLCIIPSIVLVVLTKRIINRNTKILKKENDYFMAQKLKPIQFTFRCCIILCGVMCIWPMQFLLVLLKIPHVMITTIDIVEASQGILLFCVFVCNKYAIRRTRTREEYRTNIQNSCLVELPSRIQV